MSLLCHEDQVLCYRLIRALHYTPLLITITLELQRLSMRGIQAHLDSPVETIRVRGMVLGEHLMARLHPSSGEDLEFTYDSQSEDVKWLKSLMEPLSEQVSGCGLGCGHCTTVSNNVLG